MPDTINIPDRASEHDARRIRHVNRNLRIRRDYPALRDEHGRDEALERLAEREGCSTWTVQEVVYERV
jgi:hypothetical protein